jgi:hypothetical protein
MAKSHQINCPKRDNIHNFYFYGKDLGGYQKHLCRVRKHQFAEMLVFRIKIMINTAI